MDAPAGVIRCAQLWHPPEVAFPEFEAGKVWGDGPWPLHLRKLVRLMGGSISVESEPGQGSRFHFTARFGTGSPRSPRGPGIPARLRGPRVLVVDDNATNRRILEEMLEHWRMRPTTVSGGKPALAEMEKAARAQRPYPLVLLDGNMLEMDGFALAAEMKRRPRLAGAAIMMLSSGGRPGDGARCLKLGSLPT